MNQTTTKALDVFHDRTARWFLRSIGAPTAVQEAAWPAIAAGEHTLVSAPTGAGKTLSAFLVFIDQLLSMAREGTLKQELYLIYVSPLKSLAGDIRENLRRPLEGILQEEGPSPTFAFNQQPVLNVAIRTGGTSQSERRKMIKSPPHILITTPESLYLMLTAKSGQSMLRTARSVIVDELHALIDSKRGAHLMLSLARLDKLCAKPLQRIGLSATIEPLDRATEYLSPEPVTIAAPMMHKAIELVVTSPQFDKGTFEKDSTWKEIASSVYSRCQETRSAIAFLEGRAYAEKLAHYVNQLGGEGFARTHHGSISKEQRLQVERALRGGNLRLLCATSDVGEIDQVFQIGCPRTVSGTMQRLGRSGHNPNRTSIMRIFARASSEGLYSGLTAEVVRRGGVEKLRPPRLCLDVLAQHLVSMSASGSYSIADVMDIISRAYPFRDVTAEDVKGVLQMLAGDYEHDRDIPVRPRVLYDRIHERVEGDSYSRMLAVSAGGTIPDKGLYAVKSEDGVKLDATEYDRALSDGDVDSRTRIVRRLLRYRGAHSVEQIAQRYLWTDNIAMDVIRGLCGSGNVVEYQGLYYHATLFDRARKETIKARRQHARTLPPQRYAAALARRIQVPGPRQEALEATLANLYGVYYPAPLWESVLLPARVQGYRPELLDALLAKGEVFWHVEPKVGIGETAQRLDWGNALKALRVWEYTGRVRRGYFVEGLSGMQYIRDKDYAGVMFDLEQSDAESVWLSAVDPAQPWGKCLAHYQDRAFTNVPGTAIALRGGIPVAVFERHGKTLRVFDDTSLSNALRIFVQDFNLRRIFPQLGRLTVKECPPEAKDALRSAGFIDDMLDMTLFRQTH